MKLMCLLAAPLVAGLALSASARAQNQMELVYGLGQFAGASSACQLPDDRVEELMTKLLRNVGVEMESEDDDGPIARRFAEGMANGMQAMSASNAPPCSAVVAEFERSEQQAR
ncbi:hypothetical protein [Muricoccus radiodurans]|uniref:hypothetical protein n=1 Tax=Muricoccus radiodurans TaxID=2231721 RepID=UPI003CEFC5E5